MKVNKKIKSFLIVVCAIIAINIVSSYFFFRIDLTSEGRYTLSNVTTNVTDSLHDAAFVTIYLDGELNPGFRRLRRQTIETCQEIAYSAASDIYIVVVDPAEMDETTSKSFQEELEKAGLGGVPVFETKEDGQKTRTIVFPYAKVQMGNTYVWLNLLENVPGLTAEESLNRSIESIEYKFTDALVRLSRKTAPRIAFLEGHGELDELDVLSATEALSEHFAVDRGAIGSDPSILDPYKVIIVAKPSRAFSEKDKFVLDQYLMRGGKIFWLVDAVTMTLDSLRSMPQTIGLMADHNLMDQLFIYGVRLRPSVIEDMNCGMIPVSVPKQDGGSQIVPMPWRFGPLMATNMLCPITRNVSYVHGDFASPIDTVGEELDVVRVPLLRSSAYTRSSEAPVMAQLSTIHQQPREEEFNQSHLLMSVLEEGKFKSAFAHRAVPAGLNMSGRKVMTESVQTKMVFVGDGDVIKNDVRFRQTSNPTIVPLGYDEISRQNYGNKDFVVNAVQYLADDCGLMDLKNRTFKLRLLDRKLIADGTTGYKVVTLLVPLGLIALIGGGVVFVRRRRFARKIKS